MLTFQRKRFFESIITAKDLYFPGSAHQPCVARLNAYDWMRSEMIRRGIQIGDGYPFWAWKLDDIASHESLLTCEEKNGTEQVLIVRFEPKDCVGLDSSYRRFTDLILAYKRGEPISQSLKEKIFLPENVADVQITYPYFDPTWITDTRLFMPNKSLG